eukprot:SAG11_NODE_23520_length_387_cov_0.878472_1_plen_48_part_01
MCTRVDILVVYFFFRGVRAVAEYTQGSQSWPRGQASPSGSGATKLSIQ